MSNTQLHRPADRPTHFQASGQWTSLLCTKLHTWVVLTLTQQTNHLPTHPSIHPFNQGLTRLTSYSRNTCTWSDLLIFLVWFVHTKYFTLIVRLLWVWAFIARKDCSHEHSGHGLHHLNINIQLVTSYHNVSFEKKRGKMKQISR